MRQELQTRIEVFSLASATTILGAIFLTACFPPSAPANKNDSVQLEPATVEGTPDRQDDLQGIEKVPSSSTDPSEVTSCKDSSRLHLPTVPEEGGTISQFGQVVSASPDPRDIYTRPTIGEFSPLTDGIHIKAYMSFDISSIPPDLSIVSVQLDLSKYIVIITPPSTEDDLFKAMGPITVQTAYYGERLRSDLYKHPQDFATPYNGAGAPIQPIVVTNAFELAYGRSNDRFQIVVYFSGTPQADRKLEQLIFDDTVAGVGLDIDYCLPANLISP